jgi:hypothetical protein
MAIISSLNKRIVSVFDKEKLEYREGTRSLRTYKAGLPIPIAGSDVIHLAITGAGDYSFILAAFPVEEQSVQLSPDIRVTAHLSEDEFLLRNWSYHGLKEKISYKAAKYGITVLVE